MHAGQLPVPAEGFGHYPMPFFLAKKGPFYDIFGLFRYFCGKQKLKKIEGKKEIKK